MSRYAQASDARVRADGGTPRWLLASLGAAVGFGVVIPAIGAPGRRCSAASARSASSTSRTSRSGCRWRCCCASTCGRRRAAAWPALLAAGLFETAGFACITAGRRLAPLALVSPLASLASALTVLYAWTVMRERPARAVLIGAALVCAGVVVLAL